MAVWGHLPKAFYTRKPEIFPSFLYFKNIKASVCVAHFQTVIKVWKLLTSSAGSVFPSWLHCNALWSEQRLTFCSLQLNRLSLLTFTSIFLSCLSVHPSDLKQRLSRALFSISLSVFNFISSLFAHRDLLFFLCLCLAPPPSSRFIFLSPIPDLPLVKIKGTLECWRLQLFLQIVFYIPGVNHCGNCDGV